MQARKSYMLLIASSLTCISLLAQNRDFVTPEVQAMRDEIKRRGDALAREKQLKNSTNANSSPKPNGSTNSSSPQTSNNFRLTLPKNKFQDEQDNNYSNSVKHSIENLVAGNLVYFKDDQDGGLYLEGTMMGLVKKEDGKGIYLVLATPYVVNGSGYENKRYLFYVTRRDDNYKMQYYNYSTRSKKLDDKFNTGKFDATTRQLILDDAIAEENRLTCIRS